MKVFYCRLLPFVSGTAQSVQQNVRIVAPTYTGKDKGAPKSCNNRGLNYKYFYIFSRPVCFFAVYPRLCQACEEADQGARRRAPRDAEVVHRRQPAVGRLQGGDIKCQGRAEGHAVGRERRDRMWRRPARRPSCRQDLPGIRGRHTQGMPSNQNYKRWRLDVIYIWSTTTVIIWKSMC